METPPQTLAERAYAGEELELEKTQLELETYKGLFWIAGTALVNRALHTGSEPLGVEFLEAGLAVGGLVAGINGGWSLVRRTHIAAIQNDYLGPVQNNSAETIEQPPLEQ